MLALSAFQPLGSLQIIEISINKASIRWARTRPVSDRCLVLDEGTRHRLRVAQVLRGFAEGFVYLFFSEPLVGLDRFDQRLFEVLEFCFPFGQEVEAVGYGFGG